MSEKAGRKGNSTPLVGMQIGTATMENSLEVHQKLIELPYDPAVPFLGM